MLRLIRMEHDHHKTEIDHREKRINQENRSDQCQGNVTPLVECIQPTAVVHPIAENTINAIASASMPKETIST